MREAAATLADKRVKIRDNDAPAQVIDALLQALPDAIRAIDPGFR
jgi:hypothetical protein